MRKWLWIIFPLMAFTRIHPTYDDKDDIREEFANVEDNAQDQQFIQVNSTPSYQSLKDGQIVIFKSTPNATSVTLMLRAGDTIYTLTGGGGGTTINNFAGGGAGIFVFDGSVANQISTAAFPGATVSYGTLFSTINYMPAINSTYTWALNQFNVAFASITAIGISTRTIQSFFAAVDSTNSVVNDTQNSTITIQQNLLSQRTVVASDEGGTPGSHVQQFNFVGSGISYSQTAGTGTVTVAGGGTSSFLRTYDLVIGTPGSLNVDVYVDSGTNFTLNLASLALSGLTVETSTRARIFMGPGRYTISGVTVAAGVEIFGAGPRTVLVDNGSVNGQFIKLYGKLHNLTLDLNNQGFNSPKIHMSSFSMLDDIDIVGAGVVATPFVNLTSPLIYISSATGVRIKNVRIQDARTTNDANDRNIWGAAGVLFIQNSSDVVMQFDYFNTSMHGNGGLSAVMGVLFSTDVFLVNSKIVNLLGTGFVWQTGCVGGGFVGNDVTLNSFAAITGAVVIGQNDVKPEGGISTGTIVANNTFRSYGSQTLATASIIRLGLTSDRGFSHGVRIFNNTIVAYADNLFKFIQINNGNQRTEVIGNSSRGVGSFLTDSGFLTYTAGNTKDALATP